MSFRYKVVKKNILASFLHTTIWMSGGDVTALENYALANLNTILVTFKAVHSKISVGMKRELFMQWE